VGKLPWGHRLSQATWDCKLESRQCPAPKGALGSRLEGEGVHRALAWASCFLSSPFGWTLSRSRPRCGASVPQHWLCLEP
jgi:hypothetical protein